MNQYKIQEQLGYGKFANVYKCIDTTVIPSPEDSGVRAMKVFKSQFNSSFQATNKKNEWDAIRNEINTLKRFKHDNIVRLHEVIEEKAKGQLVIITDYMPNGTI